MSEEISQFGDQLFNDIRQLIDDAKQGAAAAINAKLTMLYWQVGNHIQSEVLKGQRAQYGKQIINSLSEQLTQTYGKGWGSRKLRFCAHFADTFPNREIVITLCSQFSWSHLRLLTGIDDPLKRDFYIEISRLEHWSVRQLQDRIRSMLYERTAISKKPEETIQYDLENLRQEGKLSADLAFRDPYVLDFLGLTDRFSEQELELAILAELQQFIIELGSDFAFLARQKRITIDSQDYYIDLLFYHRRLKCLVAIDLKIGDFDAAFKGQMELYLRYLERYDKVEGENTPIGLILCTGKSEEHVELLQLDKSNIRVADYLTVLPPREVLEAKLQASIAAARQRLGASEEE